MEIYTVNGKNYELPPEEIEGFLSLYPDAVKVTDPGKLFPTAPGAVVENNIAPDMDYNLDPGSSESSKSKKGFGLPPMGMGMILPNMERLQNTALVATAVKAKLDAGQDVDPLAVVKGLFGGLKSGGAGFADTSIKLIYDDLIKDNEQAAFAAFMDGENSGEKSKRAAALIAAKDKFLEEGYGQFLKLLLPGSLQATSISRKRIDELRAPFKKIIEKERAKYDNTITEEILKGADADFEVVARRIMSDGLTSLPYTIASLNPYSATALGLAISGDKFVEESQKNPDKTLFQLYGNAITTGGIEMADALLTRRFLKSAGLMSGGKDKVAEKAIEQMNKGISRKALDILGIAGKEGLTEIGQAIATRINDKVWFDFNDVFSQGGGIFEFDETDKEGVLPGVKKGRLTKGILKDIYSIIDEGIIGAFSGGGISIASSAIQTNDILKQRAEKLLTSGVVKKEQNALVKEYAEREKEILFAKENGLTNKVKVLSALNRKVKIKFRQLQAANRLAIDNITGDNLQEYAQNIDSINALLGDAKDMSDVSKADQKEINKLSKRNNEIFDQALKEKYGENVTFAEVASKQLGLKTTIAKSTKEFEKKVKNLTGKTIKDSSGIGGVFIGKGQIIINEDSALKLGDVGVGSHEILHPILNAMIGDASMQKQIVEEFRDTLTSSQKKWTDGEMKRKGKKEGTSEYYTEYINVFSEGLVKNRISFDLNFGEQIKNWITNLYKGKGYKNIDFKSGQGVYNFLKAYDKSRKEGKLSEEVLAVLDKEAIKEVEALGKEMQKSEISNEIQDIYDKQGYDGAFEIIEAYRGMANKQAQKFRNVPGFATNSDILVDEILTGQRGVIDLIRSYNASSGVPLAAYINKFLPARAIEAANRILDTKFTSDVTEAKNVTSTSAVPGDPTPEQNVQERKSLRVSFNLNDNIIERVKNSVIKSFGTKLPEVTSAQFKKQLQKNYRTFLKPVITKFLGKQKAYEKFLNDNFKLIYDILPQSTINKRFKPFAEPVLDKDGKQKREKTAQGNGIFKKKNITKQEFVDYFIGDNVGASTKGARKTTLAEALAEEIAFDATLDVIKQPAVQEKINAIAESQGYSIPDNYLSQVAKGIDRGTDFQFSKEDGAEISRLLENLEFEYLESDFSTFWNTFTKLAAKQEIGTKKLKGQAVEYYVAKQLTNLKIPGLKITNLKELSTLATGDTGADIEIEIDKGGTIYKGTVEVKDSIKSKLGSVSFTGPVNNLTIASGVNLTQDVINKIKEEVQENVNKWDEAYKKLTGSYPTNKKGERAFPYEIPRDVDLKKLPVRTTKIIVPGLNPIIDHYNKGDINLMVTLDKGAYLMGQNPTDAALDNFSDMNANTLINAGFYSTSSNEKTRTLTFRAYLNIEKASKLLDGKPLSELQFSRENKLDTEFNNIIEQKTGILSEARFSKVKAKRRGMGKGMFNFFIPHSAEDFQGLMYSILPKGKEGNKAMEWMRQNLFRPYGVAMENISRERMALMNNWKALKKNIKDVPKLLPTKTPDGDFTYEQAIRVFIWDKQNIDIPGLTATDKKTLSGYIKNDTELLDFANQLIGINKEHGYPSPGASWDSGTITTDLYESLNKNVRQKHLTKWQSNIDAIFTEENFNKLQAAKGEAYVSALKNILSRMKSGRNAPGGGNKQVNAWLEWLNNSVGAIMFLNVRSAVLQTISTVNYINWHDNNPLKAAKAYANQPQFWKDFSTLFNSDFLKERRGGLKLNVSESEIADQAKEKGVRGAISYLLNKGFVLTRAADSFAIANGGAALYRNRINSYIKQGLSQKEAEEKAFKDFRELTEEAQQSSRPDRISMQQSSALGRVILAFANTPMQYTRLMKRGAQDLAAGRGDWKTNMSKIMYYGFVQNFIFNAMQQALFALGFDDEEDEKKKEKYSSIANGMVDSVLRGTGVGGAAVMTAKNIAVDVAKRAKRSRPNFQDSAWKLLDISPPLDSKVSKLRSAGYVIGKEKDEILDKGLSLDNPANMAIAQTISATTNVPLDRVLRLYDNTKAAVAEDTEAWQRVALLLGWSTWELGIGDDDKKLTNKGIKSGIKKGKIKRGTIK